MNLIFSNDFNPSELAHPLQYTRHHPELAGGSIEDRNFSQLGFNPCKLCIDKSGQETKRKVGSHYGQGGHVWRC